MPDLFSIVNDGAALPAPFVEFEKPGQPKGKGDQDHRIIMPRPGTKSWARGARKPFVVRYVPDDTQAYMDDLAERAQVAMLQARRQIIPTGSPVAVRLFAMFAVPKSWSNRDRDAALAGTIFPTGKPDNDNINKMLDALKGIVWADDAQVCRTLLWKEYAEHPGLIVQVYLLP